MCPKPAGETLGLFGEKEPNNKKPYIFCDAVEKNRDFAQDPREGLKKTDFSTSLECVFHMFFQRLGFFVPKARWWTRNRWTSGLWAQNFLEGPSQKSWNRVFPKDWASLCPKPVGRPATAGSAGFGHKVFWKDLLKNPGAEFFPRGFCSTRPVDLNFFSFWKWV